MSTFALAVLGTFAVLVAVYGASTHLVRQFFTKRNAPAVLRTPRRSTHRR